MNNLKICKICGRALPKSEFDRRKDCRECRELLAARPKRPPFPKHLVAECRRRTAETGIEHHIDHIVPRITKPHGPDGQYGTVWVSGLDVEANYEIVPASENLAKWFVFTAEDAATIEAKVLAAARTTHGYGD
ncbi:MAG: hypothetical protein AcusKO_33170 [Acuticoccus sp.]